MSVDADTPTPHGAVRPVHQAALRQLLLNRRAPEKNEPRIYLVRGASTWTGPDVLPGPNGQPVRIATAVSPLEVWEHVVRHDEAGDGSLLAVITDAEEHELGPNVLSHVCRYRVLITDLWEAVRQSVGATGLDPRLADEGWAAESILDAGVGRDQKLAGTLLSKDTALAHLAARRLSTATHPLDPAGIDFRALLDWTAVPGGPVRLEVLRPAEREGLFRWLAERTGQAGKVLLALCEGGAVEDCAPIGLLYDAMWQPDAPASTDRAKGRAEQLFARGQAPSDSELSSYGRSVGEHLRARLARTVGELDPATRYVLERAEHLVRQFGAEDAAARSSLLPSGLDARFTAVGAALQACLPRVDAVAPADRTFSFPPLHDALAALQAHALARFDTAPQRLERARMAARLLNWLATGPVPDFGTATEALDRFAAEYAWVDFALGYVYDGDDTDPGLQAAYRQLYAVVRDRRRAIDGRFAAELASYTADGSEPGAELTVESFARRVLAPIVDGVKPGKSTASTPLLLLLLDGMSGAAATGLAQHLRRQWIEYDPVPADQQLHPHVRRHAMFAALPTLTNVSRGSLFSGALADIRQDEERRRFENHDFWNRASVRLFHKADVRGTAGSALGDELTHALGKPDVHVAVVVNTIDDRLKEDRPISAWAIDELLGVEALLAMARDTGRAVVIVSDHGHVLDRGAARLDAAEPLSARHRTIGGPSVVGEITLAGKRVVTQTGEITALWDADLRYTDQKAGYHGGASLAEVAIPVLAFLPHGANVPTGWRELGPQEPAWWADAQHVDEAAAAAPQPISAPTSRRSKAARGKQVEGQQAMELILDQPIPSSTLQSAPVAGSPAESTMTAAAAGARPTSHDALLAALRKSELFDAQLGALPRPESAEAVEAALRALLESGGVAPLSFVAERAGKPAMRAAGFAVTLQRLFNYDQVEVLELTDGNRMLRLNVALLRSQFELPGTS